jgi:hypothetical protein
LTPSRASLFKDILVSLLEEPLVHGYIGEGVKK